MQKAEPDRFTCLTVYPYSLFGRASPITFTCNYQNIFSWGSPPSCQQWAGQPLEGALKLELVLRGARRKDSKNKTARLPITPYILEKMKMGPGPIPRFRQHNVMGSLLSRVFGFLHGGEFMLPDGTPFNSTAHLTPADVVVDSHQNPSMIAVRIKKCKTDQFGQSTTVYIRKTSTALCPVTAILCYLAIRPSEIVFVTEDGQPMTKSIYIYEEDKKYPCQGRH